MKQSDPEVGLKEKKPVQFVDKSNFDSGEF
jgi:hypothetical protein